MTVSKDNIYAFPRFLASQQMKIATIFLISFLIYANTLGHEFTQDDAIVIYDNEYVKQGIRGINKIYATDSFRGFFGDDKSTLVSGGRYRPLTISLFAIVHELVGVQPFAYHLLSILLYSLLCIIIFKILSSLPSSWPTDKQTYFAFAAALIYVVHPIHTEVVANIKGLDETLSLLFSLLSLASASCYSKSGKPGYLLLSGLLFVLALFSKENAIAFIAVIPVVLYFFSKDKSKLKKTVIVTSVLALTFIGYWMLRTSIVGYDLGDPPTEMLNNPFIKLEDNRYVPFSFEERWASITYGLGKYIQLLFFPHPLTHDYYPRHFGVVDFKDAAVWMSIIMNGTLAVIAIIGLKKRSFISFVIFFFFATIALMSNVVFPIGTHLSERFLFTPSLAFAMAMAYGFTKLYGINSYRKPLMLLIGLGLFMGAGKTIARNNAWKNDLTLFTTDVEVSKNSAKVRNAAGGALLAACAETSDPIEKQTMAQEALVHLMEATRIHPNYKEAHFLSGIAHSYVRDYDRSITSYELALQISPNYQLAFDNLKGVLKQGAKENGMNGNIQKALEYLQKVLTYTPNDADALSMMGTAYGTSGNHKLAIEYFEKAISIRPNVAMTYVNLGLAQQSYGLEDDAIINFNKAIQIDPKALDKFQNRN